MKKKKIYLFFVFLFATLAVSAQDGIPQFSTEDSPVWYSVEFKTGGAYLADQGSGNNLKTAAQANDKSQSWMFIGTEENFLMKSKAGNFVYYNGSRFASTSSGTNATTLRLVAGTTVGTWEIQRTASTGNCMNQWGGTGAGKELGEWSKGDSNNPVYFNLVEEEEEAYLQPVFSDGEHETYFMLQFAKGGNNLASQGVGNQAIVASTKNTPAQLWKFVGTADNFQLVAKDGSYATIKSGTATNGQTGNLLSMTTTPDASGFRIEASGNATYPDSWEIRYNGTTSTLNTLNQWGGASVGMSIGLWSAGDGNNPLYLVNPANIMVPFQIDGISGFRPENDLTLWYTDAASNSDASDKWMEYSLPIGNGQLGASIFGGVAKEEVQFNEKTLWSGKNTDNGTEYGDYENFGSVYIEDISGAFGYDDETSVKDYFRTLDLTNATASVCYKSADRSVNFTREYIASNPDQVVAMRLKADKPGQISLRFTMAAGRPGLRASTSYDEGTATFGGTLETVSYKALLKVVPTGGTMATDAKGITVTGADEVLVILSGATDFDAYSSTYVSNTAQLSATVEARVNDAAAKSWEELYNAHVADYQGYFNRCSFQLDGVENTMPTDDLVKEYAKRTTGTEPYALMLEQLYFAYGRYLEISSSRGVDLPSNLQGIWNNSSEPAWNADIHSNINVQMNYWPAEPTNLSEMHLPFLNYIINMATNHDEWKGYAAAAGQNEGWTCYTENNIFGGVGSFMHNYVIANAWYCTHLWQHYRYTLDRDFLKKAFPAMWSASRFWILRLKKASDGTYECPNEYSPEHGPASENGVAHAQQLVWDLLANTKAAAEVLGEEAGVSEEQLAILADRLENLDKGLATEKYTGSWGSTVNGVSTGDELLREWKYSSYTAGTNGHRHMSHLMCVYPFNQVTPSSPYFNAAVNSMKLRGDASTGWSMGWKINLWARVLDGDHAHDILELALRHHSVAGGGVYYNLYDSHSPFQIDGNFGACAGIAEMLMQSHCDTIQVLPALPAVWQTGSVKGLKAVGDFTVGIDWKEGAATRVCIVSNQGQPCFVNCAAVAGKDIYVNNQKVEAVLVGGNTVEIPAKAGDEIVIDMDGSYKPEAIGQVADELKIILSGRTVSVPAASHIRVLDLAGRTVQESCKTTICVDKAAGNVVLLQVTGKGGQTTSYKVVLK